MTVDHWIESWTTEEKIVVMEKLWANLLQKVPSYSTPAWHEEVLRERLANPSSEPRMTVEEARQRLKAELHARRDS